VSPPADLHVGSRYAFRAGVSLRRRAFVLGEAVTDPALAADLSRRARHIRGPAQRPGWFAYASSVEHVAGSRLAKPVALVIYDGSSACRARAHRSAYVRAQAFGIEGQGVFREALEVTGCASLVHHGGAWFGVEGARDVRHVAWPAETTRATVDDVLVEVDGRVFEVSYGATSAVPEHPSERVELFIPAVNVVEWVCSG
jgi:hypothetical protein